MASSTKNFAPKSHAQAFTSAQQALQKDDPPSFADLGNSREVSASEVVMMDVNAFNVSNDFYPSAREEVSMSLIDNSMVQNTNEPDLESMMQRENVPRSHFELDKIN